MISIIYAIGSALFFALTFYFRKQASKFLSPPRELLIEILIASLILITVLFFTSKKDFDISKQGILFAIIAGIFMVSGLLLNFLALKFDSLSKVVSITSPSQIIFGVLLGFILLRENLNFIQYLGITLAIVGIILVGK